jgi:hypothetical protein
VTPFTFLALPSASFWIASQLFFGGLLRKKYAVFNVVKSFKNLFQNLSKSIALIFIDF